jgi:hypothetical protein
MKLLGSRTWSAVDIAMLKWCCVLTGMIAGAYLSDFTKRHVWFFAVAVVVLAIKPTIAYFRQEGD